MQRRTQYITIQLNQNCIKKILIKLIPFIQQISYLSQSISNTKTKLGNQQACLDFLSAGKSFIISNFLQLILSISNIIIFHNKKHIGAADRLCRYTQVCRLVRMKQTIINFSAGLSRPCSSILLSQVKALLQLILEINILRFQQDCKTMKSISTSQIFYTAQAIIRSYQEAFDSKTKVESKFQKNERILNLQAMKEQEEPPSSRQKQKYTNKNNVNFSYRKEVKHSKKVQKKSFTESGSQTQQLKMRNTRSFSVYSDKQSQSQLRRIQRISPRETMRQFGEKKYSYIYFSTGTKYHNIHKNTFTQGNQQQDHKIYFEPDNRNLFKSLSFAAKKNSMNFPQPFSILLIFLILCVQMYSCQIYHLIFYLI